MKTLITIVAAGVVSLSVAVAYKTRSLERPVPIPPSYSQQTAKSDFHVEGRVINASGEAVARAKVFLESDDAGLSRIMTGVSDAEGNFRITIKESGRYTVYGSKEEDGYALTVSGFHQPVRIDQIPKLVITELKDITNVVLQLGEKAATIEGTVKDAATSQAVKSATITLRRTDNPELLYRTSTQKTQHGKFRMLVPTAPFRMEVESSGYETWAYEDRSTQGAMKLNRGELRKLQVALRRR